MTPATNRSASRIALPWVIRLRYAMALGELITATLVHFLLRIDLPLAWIAVAPGVVLASNVWLARRTATHGGHDAGANLISWIFVLDTLCLTAVLMLTGGPNNPFSLLYLVHITLSATILNRRQTWALGALACVCFGSLFWAYRPIPELEMHHRGDGVNLHLTGMWVSFAIASLLVTLFSGTISELLRENEESLRRMQEELAKKDRLTSLVTLAAGAAHELSTPLGTIAVVANELERLSMRTPRDTAITEDSQLIRREVDRCREILRRMSVEGAEPAGEALETVPVAALLEAVQSNFRGAGPLRFSVSPEAQTAAMKIPRHAVEQALIALVKNALEASVNAAPVDIAVACIDGAQIRFEIRDRGCGMSADALRHAGEPFFTTKDPGKGMGLGIFLVRTLADRLGGHLRLDSTPDVGTVAALELPLASLAEPSLVGTLQ